MELYWDLWASLAEREGEFVQAPVPRTIVLLELRGLCRDRVKTWRHELCVGDPTLSPALVNVSLATDDRLQPAHLPITEIYAVLETLPTQQRQAITLRFLKGLPYADIAAHLGTTSNSVRVSVSIGLSRLKRRLGANAKAF
jgi:DNA-directed RNA polymerase specialized sigma24 family protein